jgi:hypothetical protein
VAIERAGRVCGDVSAGTLTAILSVAQEMFTP